MLEKMLSSHAEADILSQPFPMLYRHLKRVFYEQYNYSETYYVFNKFYNEKFYTDSDFGFFLNNYEISSEEIDKILTCMKGWDGQWAEIDNWSALLKNYQPATLEGLYSLLLNYYCTAERSKIIGSKEVLIEEFVPYLIANNIKVIIIVRDPRDVITSLNVGKGTEFSGKHRPTLFHLRNWRKSIAIANTFAENKNLLIIRYEDLVHYEQSILNRITQFLDISEFKPNQFEKGIFTKSGKKWEANSSTEKFSELKNLYIQKYKYFLNENMIKYIEFMCKPEMKFMKYKVDYENELNGYDPISFKEPFDIADVKMNPDLSTDRDELELELKRKKLLISDEGHNDDINAFFFSYKNYELLRDL